MARFTSRPQPGVHSIVTTQNSQMAIWTYSARRVSATKRHITAQSPPPMELLRNPPGKKSPASGNRSFHRLICSARSYRCGAGSGKCLFLAILGAADGQQTRSKMTRPANRPRTGRQWLDSATPGPVTSFSLPPGADFSSFPFDLAPFKVENGQQKYPNKKHNRNRKAQGGQSESSHWSEDDR